MTSRAQRRADLRGLHAVKLVEARMLGVSIPVLEILREPKRDNVHILQRCINRIRKENK